jgi:hypothetical protein
MDSANVTLSVATASEGPVSPGFAQVGARINELWSAALISVKTLINNLFAMLHHGGHHRELTRELT